MVCVLSKQATVSRLCLCIFWDFQAKLCLCIFWHFLAFLQYNNSSSLMEVLFIFPIIIQWCFTLSWLILFALWNEMHGITTANRHFNGTAERSLQDGLRSITRTIWATCHDGFNGDIVFERHAQIIGHGKLAHPVPCPKSHGCATFCRTQ